MAKQQEGLIAKFRAMAVEGPAQKLMSEMGGLPRLDISGRGVGMTEYLDFLDHEDLEEQVMVGEDDGGRAFIALRIEVSQDEYAPIVSDDDELLATESCVEDALLYSAQDVVIVVHQRYSDDSDIWVSAGPLSDQLFGAPLKAEDALKLLRLIKGEQVSGRSTTFKLV